MNRNIIETVMGAVVLLVAAGVLFVAYHSSSRAPVEGYRVTANFENAGGVSPGSDVRVGGIKIGTVTDMQLDAKTFQAVVTMQIKAETKLPDDSSAAIVSDSLLGGKFVSVEPGGSDKNFADGGKIGFTQSSVSLEQMIGKFMFSGGGVDGKKADAPKTSEPATPDAAAPPAAPAEKTGVPSL